MRRSVGPRVRLVVKSVLNPLTGQFPPVVLSPERLRIWMNALVETRSVEGTVLELGCAFAGTAAYCSRMLERLGDSRPYLGIDTFDGFVREQFERDVDGGTAKSQFGVFSANSLRFANNVAARHGGSNLRLLKGDVCSTSVQFPAEVSACLVDVDLEEPVYVSLCRVYATLADGGVIIVDDCDGPESGWKARDGYMRFVTENGLPPVFAAGMGFIGDDSVVRRLVHVPPMKPW